MARAACIPEMTAASIHSVLNPVSIHAPARYKLLKPEASVANRHCVEPADDATQQLEGSIFARHTWASIRWAPFAFFGSNRNLQSKRPPEFNFGQMYLDLLLSQSIA